MSHDLKRRVWMEEGKCEKQKVKEIKKKKRKISAILDLKQQLSWAVYQDPRAEMSERVSEAMANITPEIMKNCQTEATKGENGSGSMAVTAQEINLAKL